MKYVGTGPKPYLDAAFNEYITSPGDFIGREVMPVLGMPTQSGTYGRVTREVLLQANIHLVRAPGAPYPMFDIGGEEDTFQTQGYGLATKLPEERIAQYGTFFDAEMVAVNALVRQFDLHHERRVAAKLQNTTTFTGSTLYEDVSSSNAWDDPTKDIISTVQNAVHQVWLNTGMEPNALIVTKKQLLWILRNEDIIAKFPGAVAVTPGMIEAMLPALFNLERLIVSKAIYNSADEGQSFAGAAAWSNLYASVAVVGTQGSDLSEPCVGKTLAWDNPAAGDGGVSSYYDEDTDSWKYKAKMFTDEKIFDPNFAFLMKVDS